MALKRLQGLLRFHMMLLIVAQRDKFDVPKHPATKKFLQLLKVRYANGGQPASDYKIAQMLGVTRACVSRWSNDLGGMADEVGLDVAEYLELDPDLVLAELNMDRANSLATRQFYERIIKRIQSSAALALLAFAALHLFIPSPVFSI